MGKEENIIIILDKIKHEKKVSYEAIGVKKEDIADCVKQIFAKHNNFGDLLKYLGLSEHEVSQALKETLTTNKSKLRLSRAIVRLWTKKNKKAITLREYVATEILMWGMITEFEERFAGLKRELTLTGEKIKVTLIEVVPRELILREVIPRALRRFD